MDTLSDSRNQGEGKRKCAENWIRDKRFGLDKRFIIIIFSIARRSLPTILVPKLLFMFNQSYHVTRADYFATNTRG